MTRNLGSSIFASALSAMNAKGAVEEDGVKFNAIYIRFLLVGQDVKGGAEEDDPKFGVIYIRFRVL